MLFIYTFYVSILYKAYSVNTLQPFELYKNVIILTNNNNILSLLADRKETNESTVGLGYLLGMVTAAYKFSANLISWEFFFRKFR